jgi:hypothetical protein
MLSSVALDDQVLSEIVCRAWLPVLEKPDHTIKKIYTRMTSSYRGKRDTKESYFISIY